MAIADDRAVLDHSAIYTSRELRHWHHRARLRRILAEVSAYRQASSIADIGCSNGYITNLLNEVCPGDVCGFDYLPELVDSASAAYPHIRFRRADLNRDVKWGGTFDLVCCFETLEHVGDLQKALDNILSALCRDGVLIVSVPVEVGFWGIAKYCAKMLYGYSLDEIDAGRAEYFAALMTGGDVSRFRRRAYTWGTHFGFDWRVLERRIAGGMHIEKSYTKYATRYIVARKTANSSGCR